MSMKDEERGSIQLALDETDLTILRQLAEHGNLKLADLADITSLSTSAVQARLRRLEQRGVIEGYSARISNSVIGLTLAAYIEITPLGSDLKSDPPEVLRGFPEIVSCHSVAGDASFILFVRVRNSEALEDLIDRIRAAAQVRTRTTVVLRTFYENRPPAI